MVDNKPSQINKDDVIAIATQDLRLAALLYDYVYPAQHMGVEKEDHPSEIIYNPGRIMDTPDDIGNKLIHENYNKNMGPLLTKLVGNLSDIQSGKINLQEIQQNQDQVETAKVDFLNTFVRAIYEDLTRDGVRSVPLFYNHRYYDEYYGHGDQTCLQIELFNYPLIDTYETEWKQILEIRNDNKVFHKNIRDFRLFLVDNYAGKEADYIYADLNRKITKYEEECKHYGLKLKNTKIKMLLDPRTYGVSITLSTLTMPSSDPWTIGIAALIGITIDLGRMKIKVDNKLIEYDSEINNPELGYLVELKKLEHSKF